MPIQKMARPSGLDTELATYTLEDIPRALQAMRRDPVLVNSRWGRFRSAAV